MNKKVNKKLDNNYEDEFFKEDSSQNTKIAIVVAVVLSLIAIIAIVFMLTMKGREDPERPEDTISKYNEIENEPIPTESSNVISRDEDKEETQVETPSPTIVPEETEVGEEELPSATPGPVMELNVNNYSKVKFDTKSNLKEMEGYFETNNLQAMSDLAHLDRFIAMSYALRNTNDYYYYGDVNSNGEPDGKGIAVYADNQYYAGEWSNGLRQGAGVWVHYHIHLTKNLTDPVTFHEFIGHFSNDLPNGEGQDHYEYDNNLLVGTDRYITNFMTTYKDGLIDGYVYCTTTTKSGSYDDFEGNAKNGSLIYVSESRDSKKAGPVMTNRENPDDYYWMSEKDNKNIGVKNYISNQK
ncbi:MAG: hypothetical protein MJZ11_00210 [Lachnospiraceae bacterium]|nr:hypothetical protein [Lachnospiraceae bacterium]